MADLVFLPAFPFFFFITGCVFHVFLEMLPRAELLNIARLRPTCAATAFH